MSRRRDLFLVMLVLLLVAAPNALTQTSTPPSGSGTSVSPYQIDSLPNLYWLTQNSGAWGAYFLQTADIVASSDSSWNSGAGFTPIGTPATFFTGSYDGGGHTITGLYIYSNVDNSVGWGLFATAKNATIKNVSILNERVTVTASGSVVGGLVGSNAGSTIDSCSTTGAIYGGGNDAGGLVGSNNNDLGITSGGHITRSYSTAAVSGGKQTLVGGLVGENYDGVISGSYSMGNVIDDSTSACVGGLVGINTEGGSISNCYSRGSSTGTGNSSLVGGFAGYNYSVSTISNCYSTGTVTGNSSYGGFIGYLFGGSVSNCFWDIQTSGQTFNGGGTGNNSVGDSTSAMKTQSTFTNASWDFSGTWALDPSVNNGYPGFFWFSGYAAKSPAAATDSGTSLTYSSATLNGSVAPYKDTTTVKFIYGTATGVYPDTVAASQSPIYGYGSTPVSQNISGLAASTTYYYRVIANSTLGTAEGNEISFTTLQAPSAPTAVTDSVSSIAATSATAYGSANPNGDTTTVRFIYGTVSGTYTDSVTAAQSPLAGYSSSHVTANLSGLTSSQTYYLRIAASNGVGYVRGSEISFTTAVLVPETAPSGSGTSLDPYIIASLNNLAWLQDAANNGSWGGYFKQTANINASLTSTLNSGAGLSPIGTGSNFSGTYDGQGYVIDSLYVSRTGSDNQGLFSTLSPSAVVDSLGVTNANVSGYDLVGALVGLNTSGASIRNCYSTGKVYASHGNCGGLVGENDGKIALSFSACNVSGGSNYSMGGLVGYTTSGSDTISNCYTTGEVSVSCGGAGGLVGNHSGGAVVNCYSVSKVSAPSAYGGLIGGNYTTDAVTNSFYDTDSTGTSAAGTGETSSTLKTLSTFTNAGWDFVLETTNGTNDYWEMDTTSKVINNGYPFFYWEVGGTPALPVEMASFTATSNRLSANLEWKTATEVNTSGWEVERKETQSKEYGVSSMKNDWARAGFVKGAGTSTSPKQYSFVDRDLSAGNYSYRLKQIDNNGSIQYSKTVNIVVGNAPRVFMLGQNYPNPFNPTTTIEFTLQMDGRVSLKVYDILGRQVATLLDENRKAGEYQQVVFDGSRYSTGVYFAVLQSGGKQYIKKMLMVK